ncbi:MAG: hypothetical protein M5R36_23550 [Deltaproteobacteria bacterium]|nr:hypothetical protein [Deltaproteobacteria bacterium]
MRAHFEERGLTVTASVAESPEIRALLLERVAKINAELPSYETIKDFRLLDHEFTETSGELTPTLKLKRKIITQKYATLLEEMYR